MIFAVTWVSVSLLILVVGLLCVRHQMVSAPALTSDVMKDVKDNLWGVVFCAVLWPGVAVAYLIWCLGDAGRYCTKAVIYVAVTRPRKRLHPVERYPSQDLRKVEEPTIPDPGQVQ